MDVLATVSRRLKAMGYEVTSDDKSTLELYIEKAEAELKARTNQFKVPDGLVYIWADMAAGLFLTDKKISGALLDIYDFDAPARVISEGDTSVTFAREDKSSFEAQFDALLARMSNPPEDMIIRFRRLVW